MSGVVPVNTESAFVKSGEVIIKRWEGECHDPGHNKWWAAALIRGGGAGLPWYICRSANGSFTTGGGQIHELKQCVTRQEAEKVFQTKVGEKRNLGRTRAYSYVGEMKVKEEPAIDPNNPPIKPASKNPRIESGLIARIMVGGN